MRRAGGLSHGCVCVATLAAGRSRANRATARRRGRGAERPGHGDGGPRQQAGGGQCELDAVPTRHDVRARVGERSDLTVGAGVDAVKLQKGSLYGKFAKGAGATIGGRSAVAAVKGTVIEFIIEKDGTEVIRCHAGEVEVSRAP
jgi:hypothetical protein